ncbi:hypothetical protein [Granulicatella sp.]
MLGKCRVVSIVLLSICLASCGQQKVTQETTLQESVTTVEQIKSTNFQLGKGSNQFNAVSLNETFKDKSVVAHYAEEYPDFIPQVLSEDGKLYGSVDHVGILEIDLKTNQHQLVHEVSDATISHQWVRAVDKNWVFFEEFTDSKETANFYLLNRTTGEVTTVKENEKMPLIHHINAFFTEESQLVFNIVKDSKKDTSSNTLHLLEPTTMKEQVIDQNTFSPMIFDGKLYYIRYDATDNHSEVVQYDRKSGEKQVTLTHQSATEHLNHLFTDKHELYVSLGTDLKSGTIYHVNQAEKKYDWVYGYASRGFVQQNHLGYMSYSATDTESGRYKTPYRLIDLQHHNEYDYDGSMVFLSEKGMAWIAFKKDTKEIPKGEIFRNENSEIHYVEFE